MTQAHGKGCLSMAKRSHGLSVVNRQNIVYGWSKTGRSQALSETARAAFLRAQAQLLALDARSGAIKESPKRKVTRARGENAGAQ
jgi:hypothetical protein